jgi:hypothetical protein
MTDRLDTPGAMVSRELDAAGRPPSRRRRRTTHITKKQTENLIYALEFADAIGLPLNTSVDINWVMCAGFTDDRTRIAHLQERLSKWCKRNGFPLTMIWVREMGEYGNSNLHILLHLPPKLTRKNYKQFRLALERTLEPEGGTADERAIRIQSAYDAFGKLRYMLKGIEERHAQQFGLKASFQGELEGKRVGSTQNIGKTARKKRHPNWIRAQDVFVGTPDAENLRSNKTYGPAKPENTASKFEGGIQGTNVDAATGSEEITVTEEFGSSRVAASRPLITNLVARRGG